jgi:iron complex outermembrane recepter protein
MYFSKAMNSGAPPIALLAASLGGFLMVSCPAWADTVNDADAIIVTATRREESVLQVPLSIVATSRERLDNDRIQTINDLARSTPALSLRGAWAGTQKIAIRGIASGVGAATTGIYIDDTPIQTRSLGSADTYANTYPEIFDIQRIEVLRGPQGTLFGAGSEGGTVRFITSATDLRTADVYGRASVATTEGGTMSWQAGASASTPLIEDRLALRLTAFQKHDGGWIDRRKFGDPGAATTKNSNDRDVTSLRASAAFALTPDIVLTPSIFYQRLHRHDTDQYWETLSDPDDDRYVNGAAVKQLAKDRFLLPAMKAEITLGSVKLLSNTAWFVRRSPSITDYSFHTVEGLTRGLFAVPPGLPGYQVPVDFTARQNSFTQEVRLQSTNDATRLKWTAGLFYQRSRQQIVQHFYDPQLPLFTAILGGTPQQIFGVGLLPGDYSFASYDRSRDRQLAAFGQVDWKATERLTLTLGARQSHNKVSSVNAQDGPYNFGPSARDGGSSDDSFTPRAAASYRIAGQGLVYASATRGFRPGGGNFSVSRAFCAGDLAALGMSDVPGGFGADRLWSYEVGAKAGGRRVRAQASAFYTDWRDIQQAVPLVTCGASYTANLGRAISKGFDAQLELEPVDGLQLRGSVAYTDSYYTRSTFSGGQLLAADGDRLPTPPWQLRLSSRYEFPIARTTGFVQLDYDYASGYQRLPEAPAQGADAVIGHATATHLAGLRGGVQLGPWQATAFIDNLFDSTDPIFRTRDSIFASIVRRQGFRPRSFGLELIYRM